MQHGSLGRRVLITNIVLVLGILVLAGVSLWSFWVLRDRVLEVADEYDEVRLVEKAMRHIAEAKTCVVTIPLNSSTLIKDLTTAHDKIKELQTFEQREQDEENQHQNTETSLIGPLLTTTESALTSLKTNKTAPWDDNRRTQLLNTLDFITRDLLKYEAATDVEGTRQSATAIATMTYAAIIILSGLLMTIAIIISIRGYRKIMSPIRQLQSGVRRIAAGRFQHRLNIQGDSELMELADDFNRMATELDTLYRVMEQKIAQKSHELVRSERLASVGYLAAGVAHEINNPLGIMSGYAEMAKKWLDGSPNPRQIEESREALETIRSEAFRCKKITEQLLSLSQTGKNAKAPVAIARVVSEMVRLASGPKGLQDRRVAMNCRFGNDVTVMGDEAELKQVLLNLIINALHATEPEVGQVTITLEKVDETVQLTIVDNGCGIDAESLPNVFEPFWTNHRNGEKRGFGLGLSISHAIIEEHDGQLTAESRGIGMGSQFTVTLPLAGSDDHHV